MSFIILENSVTTVIAYNSLETSKGSVKQNPNSHTNYCDPQTTGGGYFKTTFGLASRIIVRYIDVYVRNIIIPMDVLKAFHLIQHN